jgi:Flp pilus assembly protein TadG
MQNKQKGQSIIEFALVLPLFLLLVFGLFYIGMFFADYLTLSSIARSSAREAAIIPSEDYYKDNYKKVRDKYKDEKLPMDIFDWRATSTEHFNIKYDKNSQNVQVIMKADFNTQGSQLGNIVSQLAGGMNLAKIDITYSMYSEYKPK